MYVFQYRMLCAQRKTSINPISAHDVRKKLGFGFYAYTKNSSYVYNAHVISAYVFAAHVISAYVRKYSVVGFFAYIIRRGYIQHPMFSTYARKYSICRFIAYIIHRDGFYNLGLFLRTYA